MGYIADGGGNMNAKSCFFIGHRDADPSIVSVLSDTIAHCIVDLHVRYFYVGHYGSFDRLVEHTVIAAKKQHPEIMLYRVLAYHPSERQVDLPKGYDGAYYPEGMETVPKRFAIDKVNRLMIDRCDCLIAYATHPASNTCRFIEYAKRKGTVLIKNLGDYS